MKKILIQASILLFVLIFAGVFPARALEFSADMVSTSRGQTYTSKTYIKGMKYRMEMSGQPQFTIVRQDKNVMWMVMPAQKSFIEMPFEPKQKPRVDAKPAGEVSRKLLGSETTDGHPTQKYEVTVKEGNKTERLLQWMATDLNFPIKISAIDGSWVIEYKNIKTAVPDNLFEIPSGYRKISVPSIPGMGGGFKPPAP